MADAFHDTMLPINPGLGPAPEYTAYIPGGLITLKIYSPTSITMQPQTAFISSPFPFLLTAFTDSNLHLEELLSGRQEEQGHTCLLLGGPMAVD